MSAVAIVVHHGKQRAAELAGEAARWLQAAGHEPRLAETDAAAVGLTEFARAGESLLDGLDLAVSLGGDGTMLRAVDLVSAAEVPVLGVNIGQLGYLTEVEAHDLSSALTRFFSGDYKVEERMTIEVTAESRSGDVVPPTVTGLNEAWLEKTVPGHTVRLAVTIGDSPWTSYAADGFIIATPTGSTAYNLSVRGPIVSPALRALVLTPVSPHMAFDLSLVLGPEEEVRIDVLESVDAALLVDGRPVGTLRPGDAIVCRAGPHSARLVTFGRREFFRIVKAKFGLTDR